MPKNYTWHLVCETHEIDEWASCQTTGNDAENSQRFITEYAEEIRDEHNCSKAIDNLATLVEETELA